MKPRLANPLFDFGIADAKRTTRYWRIVFRMPDRSLTRFYFNPRDGAPSRDSRLNTITCVRLLYTRAELSEVR